MAEITYSSDISQRTTAFASMKFLKVGQFLLVTERFGQPHPMPKNKGTVIKFRRYECLVPATSPVAEGVTPSGQKLRYTDVTATLQQYMDVVWITDVIEDTHEDPVLNIANERAAQEAAEVVEMLRIGVLKAGSTVFYQNNVTARTAVNGPPLRGDLRRIVRYFNRNKASKISSIIKASPLVSTEPVAAAFFALGHTDLEPDYQYMVGFTPVEKYSDSDKALPGEVGKCEQIRFICSPLFTAWDAAGTDNPGTQYISGGAIPSAAVAPDVYPIIIIAKDSYGIVPLQGMNAVDIKVKNPGSIDKSDPGGQRGFLCWKTWQASAILNDLWLVRYEVSCTALPD